jgi:hypothetical protein
MLPARDADLAYFETWLAARLKTFTDPTVRRPRERFATWHHLERIRRPVYRGDDVHGATHTAKQEITEIGRFLGWLADRQQTIDDCTQADLEVLVGLCGQGGVFDGDLTAVSELAGDDRRWGVADEFAEGGVAGAE